MQNKCIAFKTVRLLQILQNQKDNNWFRIFHAILFWNKFYYSMFYLHRMNPRLEVVSQSKTSKPRIKLSKQSKVNPLLTLYVE